MERLSDIDIMDDRFEIYSNYIDEVDIVEDEEDEQIVNTVNNRSLNIDPEDISKGIEGAGKLAGLFSKTETEKELKLECGRKPLLGKDKKATYSACKAGFFERMNAPAPSADSRGLGYGDDEDEGMSMGVKIGIGVGVLAILGLGTYFIMKKK